jgi:hypothetical protein
MPQTGHWDCGLLSGHNAILHWNRPRLSCLTSWLNRTSKVSNFASKNKLYFSMLFKNINSQGKRRGSATKHLTWTQCFFSDTQVSPGLCPSNSVIEMWIRYYHPHPGVTNLEANCIYFNEISLFIYLPTYLFIFETTSHFVVQAGLEFSIVLP